jgi:PAS domain S-box-containing protein
VASDGHVGWRNANWQQALGWREHELRSQLFTDLAHPDDSARTIDAFQHLTNGQDRIDFENRCRAKDGTYRVLSWRMALADGVVLVAGTNITERRLVEQELQRLQEQGARRTAELEGINKELEAFNYAVSHDLRAPLRAIDGFTATVARRYADQLDDSGQELIARVRNRVAKMTDLINAMLVLSRLSRQQMRREHVDLSELAHEVAGELRDNDPHRSVELVIADGLTAVGDRDLLRVVLENLLGNAWKFTANTDDARIEFGREEENGSPVFVVRDNGAGFEMAYADQLFAPFQRLHREDEFSGIGVGLATVQRIIRRHGGSIGGEGRPNEGAEFHFHLDGEAEEQP